MNDLALQLFRPILQKIQDGASPEVLLGTLAELYPEMDASGLQERLARVIFTARLWGLLHG